MPSRPPNSRPNFSRQRSNSVPTFSLVNVSAEEAGILCSTAERAAARRKRPVSVDSPGPAITRSFEADSLPGRTFNFSTPSRLGVGQTPLRAVQRRSSVKTLPPLPVDDQEQTENGDVDPTPLAHSASASIPLSFTPRMVSPVSPMSPARITSNPKLKAYADGLLQFTQDRLNTAAPQTLRTLGLKRDRSMPATPELDINELPRPASQRPVFRSNFSDWSSVATSSVFGPSSPPSPNEPHTPYDQTALMTPDSFFSEITPRVAQTAQWAAMTSGRPSSGIDQTSFYSESPGRPRADSVTSTEAFSYFAGFDGATSAGARRISSDFSPVAQRRLQNPSWLNSQRSSVASNHTPYTQMQAQSPYREMMGLARTSSHQVPAME